MFWENRSLVDGEISYPLGKGCRRIHQVHFQTVSKEKFCGIRAATTALLGQGFAICVIIVSLDGQRKVVPNYVNRLEQTLNKPVVVLVVGVVAVALNVLLYFGVFVPRMMTPLIANIHSLGTSLPEAIVPESSSKSDSEASGKSDSGASGGKSDSEVGSKSDSEASGGKSVLEASSGSDSEASSSESVREASGKPNPEASGESVPERSPESDTGSPAATPSGSPPVSQPQQQSSPTPQQQQYL